MPDLTTPVPASLSPFETARQTRPDGTTFWSARDLMPLLGYDTWRRFDETVERAKAAAANTGIDVTSGFLPTLSKTSELGGRPSTDYELTRHACYLVAMNGDPRKPEVAAAQTYFAVKTREAEVLSQGDDLDAIEGLVQAIRADRQRLTLVEGRQTVTEARVAALEGHHDWFTALAYARVHGHATERAYLARVGRRAAQLTRASGEEPHPRQDATFGTVNTYPVAALTAAFAAVSR